MLLYAGFIPMVVNVNPAFDGAWPQVSKTLLVTGIPNRSFKCAKMQHESKNILNVA